MHFDRKEIKRNVRLAMRDHRPSIYLISATFIVTTMILNTLVLRLQYPGMNISEIIHNAFDDNGIDLLMKTGLRQNYISKVIEFSLRIMLRVISAGFILVCLSVSRHNTAGFGTLLDPFGFLLKIIWLNIITVVLTTLWSILLIVPGIIAAYRYSFAIYILLDDPSKSVIQCIHESKVLTNGNKFELFILDLSFLGWLVLGIIPIVRIYSLPFWEITRASYYDSIRIINSTVY